MGTILTFFNKVRAKNILIFNRTSYALSLMINDKSTLIRRLLVQCEESLTFHYIVWLK